jgi:hypothetical protein
MCSATPTALIVAGAVTPTLFSTVGTGAADALAGWVVKLRTAAKRRSSSARMRVLMLRPGAAWARRRRPIRGETKVLLVNVMKSHLENGQCLSKLDIPRVGPAGGLQLKPQLVGCRLHGLRDALSLALLQ